ncbi:MAG: M20 metallopeptidase family protein [Deltaproteobacteria bacterium]
MYSRILQKVAQNQAAMTGIRNTLHQCPGLGFEVSETADIIEKYLSRWKIPYRRLSNNGIIAEIGKKGQKVLAIRADMDGLQIYEGAGNPFKSRHEGIMHACGHDAHMAIVMGAAKTLKETENDLNGIVRFIFQPAEETALGANQMIAAGCLHYVNAIIGLHVDPSMEAGCVGMKNGTVFAGTSPFDIRIKGKSVHIANHQEGIDAALIAAKILCSLDTYFYGKENVVAKIGTMSAGTVRNAIAEEAVLKGSLRIFSSEARSFYQKKIQQTAQKIAEKNGGTASVAFKEGCPVLSNNHTALNRLFRLSIQEIGIDLKEIEHPPFTGEDFAFFSQHVPSLYFRLGCRNEEKGIAHPLHSNLFDIDESCLSVGCSAICTFAINYLNN